MVIHVALLAIAFAVIGLATQLAIDSIERFAGHVRLSKITLSLIVLGTLTSFPEIFVTANSLLLNAPQIALGSLIGSQIFLLFLVVPVLAIVGRGLHLNVQMKNVSLILALLLALVPMVALLDQGLGRTEVIVMLGMYAAFFITFTRESHFLEKIGQKIQSTPERTTIWEAARLGVAMAILLLASNVAVRQLVEVAAVLQTPRFLLSLLILPIGTNLPELSLVFGSLVGGKKELALGNYLGAVTFNALLIALLTLISGGSLLIGQNINVVIGLFIAGLVVFWWCCYSKAFLNVKEALLLLGIYLLLIGAASWQAFARLSF